MKRIKYPVTYIDLPGTFEALQGLTTLNPIIYIKFVDAEGFDLSLPELKSTSEKVLGSPLTLQYVTVKIGEEKAILDFDFQKGESNIACENEYMSVVEKIMGQIDNLKEKSLLWYCSTEKKGYLIDIILFETGRYLARCTDKSGQIWLDPNKDRQVSSENQAGIILFTLAHSFTGSSYAPILINNISQFYNLSVEKLRERQPIVLVQTALSELNEQDAITQLVRAVVDNRKNIIELLKIRQAVGYWTIEGKPHSVITAIASEMSILKLKEIA